MLPQTKFLDIKSEKILPQQYLNTKLRDGINKAKEEFKLREEERERKLKLLGEVFEKVEKIIFSQPFILSEYLEEVFKEIGDGEVTLILKNRNSSVKIEINKYTEENEGKKYFVRYFVFTSYKIGYIVPRLQALFAASYFIPADKTPLFEKAKRDVTFYTKDVTIGDIQKAIKIIDESKKIKVEIEVEKHKK
jgi:hypothetical protein